MFSEYASKFLQQSQTRMSAIRDGRITTQRPSAAPLFHSAADYLPEDPEREEEVLHALQGSRRHFDPYGPSTSTAAGIPDEYEDSEDGEYSEESTQELRRSRGMRRGPYPESGLKSSWEAKGARKGSTSKTESIFSDRTADGRDKGKGKMVDVQLDDSEAGGFGQFHNEGIGESSAPESYFAYGGRKNSESDSDSDNHRPPPDISIDMGDGGDSQFQNFKRPPQDSTTSLPFASNDKLKDEEETPFMRETVHRSPTRGPERSVMPQQVDHPRHIPPSYDQVWGSLYIFLMGCMFATSFIVWLHTETKEPSKRRLADTIYNTLHQSMHLLAVDTVVAVGLALTWMYLLRSFVKPLIYVSLVVVPMMLVGLSIYPFVMSFKTGDKGYGAQDRVMRWGSVVPAIMAVTWVYAAWTSKQALHRAVGIIQLSCKILGDNPALVLMSFGTLIATCAFTWIWVMMFTRAFLTGNVLVRDKWIWTLSSKTVALGIYYIIMYLWTLGVASGIHRCTSAASVSQWYFYRHATPTPTSKAITNAALTHSTTTIFGSICFHAFVALLVRLPLYIAPRRIIGLIHLLCFQFISSPVAALINPLTLSYAAIHSQPLITSSRAITSLKFVDSNGYGPNRHPRAAYRLSRMILTAARGITALTLGTGAWVAAARNVNGGSAYGYLVGLIAGSIGWAILGATEGCLSNVVDATLVCVGTEDGAGSHCREAQMVFGG